MKNRTICIALLISIVISNTSAQNKEPFNRYRDHITRLCGVIDTSGKIIIKARYSTVNPFYRYDSLFKVQINRKSGIINLNDDFVIPPIYDYIGSYSNTDTIFRVTSGFPPDCKAKSWTFSIYYTQGLSGYVDINHDTIIPIKYPHITGMNIRCTEKE